MLGWQESTLKIHMLELYDEFDNLVTGKYSVLDLGIFPRYRPSLRSG